MITHVTSIPVYRNQPVPAQLAVEIFTDTFYCGHIFRSWKFRGLLSLPHQVRQKNLNQNPRPYQLINLHKH